MKFIFIPRIYILIVLILSINLNTLCSKLSPQKNTLYKKRGKDWSGICANGEKQSPINIILNSNTLDSTNVISVNYKLDSSMVNKQLFFDGDKMSFEVNLGTLTYKNVVDGVQELYNAYKIEIHYPSEHYITMDGRTPRYEVELQIHHNLLKTNNQVLTNSQIKVNRAIVSILFTIGHQEEGDVFFNNMGISKYNLNEYGKINIPKTNQHVSMAKNLPASYGIGFNYTAFQGLLNLINSDPETFFYYGSETTPPCREDVLWMVFAQPRSIGSSQTEFIKEILTKGLDGKVEADKLYGNSRRLILFNDKKRGKILYNKSGLKQVSSNSFFSVDEPAPKADTNSPSNIYD